MATQFHHGFGVLDMGDGSRPIRTVTTSTIGVVGTAPGADTSAFTVNSPRLVIGREEAAKLGTTGTLPAAMNAIFDQAGPRGAPAIVVNIVPQGASVAETTTNIIGGVEASGQHKGISAFSVAQSITGSKPKILIAPGFSDQLAVASALGVQANALAGFTFFDGPDSTDAVAKTYRQNFDLPRACLIDPWCTRRGSDGSTVAMPSSAIFAGVLASSDIERGFWTSPSNRAVSGITGTTRAIDYSLSQPTSRGNLLNADEISTIVRVDGWRTLGNRTLSSDPKWAFIHIRRIADAINESLLAAHLWAMDKNLTRTYFDEVANGVTRYIKSLQAISGGAIIGGECWADPALNTYLDQSAGRAVFDFNFAAAGVAENITFRSRLDQTLLEEILA